MAHITKTPAGTWKATIRRTGWPTVVKTFRLKRDAEDWARNTEDEMVQGIFIKRSVSDQLMMSDALDRYIKEIQPRKSEDTQKRELPRIHRFKEHFKGYSLAAITPELIAQYRDERLAQGLSNDTVRLELSILSHLYNIAIKEWHIGLPMNPMTQIYKPKAEEGRDRRLEPDEEEKLIQAMQNYSNPMLRWIVCIAIETSMRKGEILKLTRNQINLQDRYLILNKTKNGSQRLVPLNQRATELFRLALNNPIQPEDTDLIFYGHPGHDGIRRPYQYDKAWANIRKELGIQGLRFHDLRHEAVSRLVEADLSDQSVSAISGHKSMQMMKRYAHLRAKKLVEKLDQIDQQGT